MRAPPPQVVSAATGASVEASSLLADAPGRVLLPFLTQFGDFDSFETAQKLVDYLPQLAAGGVTVAAVGIGSRDAALAFAAKTKFPADLLYADADGSAAAALRFSPGCGRKGGALPFLEALPPSLGIAKLLLMCAGVGSPGTLAEVFRGYLGDKTCGRCGPAGAPRKRSGAAGLLSRDAGGRGAGRRRCSTAAATWTCRGRAPST